MSDLEQRLDDDLTGIYDESARSLNYKATYLLAMLRERGALTTARHLLHKEGVSEGFTKLWEAKRLDLTVEAIVLKPEYASLFSPEERDIARRRLAEVNYTAPWDDPDAPLPPSRADRFAWSDGDIEWIKPPSSSSVAAPQTGGSLLNWQTNAEQHVAEGKSPSILFDESALDELIERFRQQFGSFETAAYGREERNYKLDAAERLRNVFDQDTIKALIDAGNFAEGHRLVRSAMWGNNLLNQWDVQPVFNADPETAVRALYDLLYGDEPFEQRFNAWVTVLSAVKPNCWPMATYYLMLHDPARHIFVKPTPFRTVMKQIKATLTWQAHPTAEAYEQLRELSAAILERLRPLGARDMIDVQSFIWIVQKEADGTAPANDESEDDDNDDSDASSAGLSLEQWRAQVDTAHPQAQRIAAEYPEWLAKAFGARVEFRSAKRQIFWVMIGGRRAQRGRINKRGGMWMWLRALPDEDQQYLSAQLADPTTLQDRTINGMLGQRFIINTESDYQLVQEITRRQVERSLGELWPAPNGGPTFVVTHSRDMGEQVYGETYVYSNRAGGAHSQLSTALATYKDGGPPVRLIIYRPGPHYAFTAWAEVVDISESPGQNANETMYTLTLDQREFPAPLNLKGNGKALLDSLTWLSKGLAVAFKGHTIKPISAADLRTIIAVARVATEDTMSIGDAAYTILSNAGGGPLKLEDIIKRGRKRKLIADSLTATSLSSALLTDERFTTLGGSSWLLAPAVEPVDVVVGGDGDDDSNTIDLVDETDDSALNLSSETRFWRIHMPRSYWEEARQNNVVAIGFVDSPNSPSVNNFRSINVGDRIVAYFQGVIGGFGVVTRPLDEHQDPLAGTPAGLFGGTLQRRIRVAWSDLPAKPTDISQKLNNRYQGLYNKVVNPHTVRRLVKGEYVILLNLSGAVDPGTPRNESRLPTIWNTLASYRDFISDLEDQDHKVDDLLQAARDEDSRLPDDLDGETLAEALRQMRLLTTVEPGTYRRQSYTSGDQDMVLRLMALALLIPLEGTADQYTLPARTIFKRHQNAPMPQKLSDFAPELGDDNERLLNWYSQAGLIDTSKADWRWSDDAFDLPAGLI